MISTIIISSSEEAILTASMLAGLDSTEDRCVVLLVAQPMRTQIAIAKHVLDENRTFLSMLPLINICFLPENLVLFFYFHILLTLGILGNEHRGPGIPLYLIVTKAISWEYL
jgi:hypothetical protein